MGKLGQQMLYNPQPVLDDEPELVQGYSEKEVKKALNEAAKLTKEYWKECVDMLDIHKFAFRDVAYAVAEGRIDGDQDSITWYYRKRKHERASRAGFDLEAAEQKFVPSKKK